MSTILSQHNPLADLEKVLRANGWPRELWLPRTSWIFVCRFMGSSDIHCDDAGAFYWFQGVKVRPPRPTKDVVVDLSDTPEDLL